MALQIEADVWVFSEKGLALFGYCPVSFGYDSIQIGFRYIFGNSVTKVQLFFHSLSNQTVTRLFLALQFLTEARFLPRL